MNFQESKKGSGGNTGLAEEAVKISRYYSQVQDWKRCGQLTAAVRK